MNVISKLGLSLGLFSPTQVLGTPTREEIKCMNPNYTEFKFPQIKAHPWHKVLRIQLCLFMPSVLYIMITECVTMCTDNIVIHSQIFHKRTPPEAVDLVSRLLQYSPNLRSTAVSLLLNFSNLSFSSLSSMALYMRGWITTYETCPGINCLG